METDSGELTEKRNAGFLAPVVSTFDMCGKSNCVFFITCEKFCFYVHFLHFGKAKVFDNR